MMIIIIIYQHRSNLFSFSKCSINSMVIIPSGYVSNTGKLWKLLVNFVYVTHCGWPVKRNVVRWSQLFLVRLYRVVKPWRRQRRYIILLASMPSVWLPRYLLSASMWHWAFATASPAGLIQTTGFWSWKRSSTMSLFPSRLLRRIAVCTYRWNLELKAILVPVRLTCSSWRVSNFSERCGVINFACSKSYTSCSLKVGQFFLPLVATISIIKRQLFWNNSKVFFGHLF